MTETDATKLPLHMPEKFLPYLERYRIYQIFKDMVRDLVLNLPKDHLKHMKVYLMNQLKGCKDTHRVMLLVSPDLDIDKKKLVKEIIRDLGFAVITRDIVMDFYAKHDDYVKGCISPGLLATVTKDLTLKEPAPQTGWLMMDHPCNLREARCLQQEGVLPTVTLLISPPAAAAPTVRAPRAYPLYFHEQDVDALQYAYKGTLKEVILKEGQTMEQIAVCCFNAIRACGAGAQGAGRGLHALGAPGVYRILLLGPRGSGRNTQAHLLAKRFHLIHINFQDLYHEASLKHDEIGEKLRYFGPSVKLMADIINRRILEKDCIDHGWVMTGYPNSGNDFENLDNMKTPPNRIMFLNVDWGTCKSRVLLRGTDWCTGRLVSMGSGPRVLRHPRDHEAQLEYEMEYYFTEALAELRAAAGMTAVEVDGKLSPDQVQIQLQAAIMAAPAFDIERCSQIRNVAADEASIFNF